DSPIQKLQDLKGKTIGAPSFGAGGGLGLKQNLSEIGITPDQYNGIATGAGPSAIAALRSGQIDALVRWDAMLGAAENTGLALRIVNIPLEVGMGGPTLATSTARQSSRRRTAWAARRPAMPDFPPAHLGEVLREDFLKPLQLSQYALAKAMGVTMMVIVADMLCGGDWRFGGVSRDAN